MFKSLCLMFFTSFSVLATDSIFNPYNELAANLELTDKCFDGSAFNSESLKLVLASNPSFHDKLKEIDEWATKEQNGYTILDKLQSSTELTKSYIYDTLIDHWFFKQAKTYIESKIPAYEQIYKSEFLQFCGEIALHIKEKGAVSFEEWHEFRNEGKGLRMIIADNLSPFYNYYGNRSFIHDGLIHYFIEGFNL